jgi:DNA-binding NtrC family response regulator
LSDVLHKAQIFRETSNAGGRSVELFRSLVGNSRAVKHIRTLIDQVADSEANVLILGESGTGKEVVARNLHYHSSRRNKPFVPVNCGAIPTICWRASYLVTKRVLLLAPSVRARVALRWLRTVRCFWTRSAT